MKSERKQKERRSLRLTLNFDAAPTKEITPHKLAWFAPADQDAIRKGAVHEPLVIDFDPFLDEGSLVYEFDLPVLSGRHISIL